MQFTFDELYRYSISSYLLNHPMLKCIAFPPCKNSTWKSQALHGPQLIKSCWIIMHVWQRVWSKRMLFQVDVSKSKWNILTLGTDHRSVFNHLHNLMILLLISVVLQKKYRAVLWINICSLMYKQYIFDIMISIWWNVC